MSGSRPSRGVFLPGVWQSLVIVAAVCAAWLLWAESRNGGWLTGFMNQQPKPVDQAANEDPLDRLDNANPQLLVAVLGDDSRDVRYRALLKLASLGLDAPEEAIDAIRERLADSDHGIRHAALSALWRVSQDPAVVLPILPEMLADESSTVSAEAIDILVAIGPSVTGVVTDLLESDSAVTRSRALLILQRIVCRDNCADLRNGIQTLANDPDPTVRAQALVARLDWGIVESDEISFLLRADLPVPVVDRDSTSNRNSCDAALEAITRLGPDAADLLPELVLLLEYQTQLENEIVRTDNGTITSYWQLNGRIGAILRALSALKTAARPAAPALLSRIDRLEVRNQLTVIGTLIDIGVESDKVTPMLIPHLGGSDHSMANWAARLLARSDPVEARRQVALLIPKFADLSKPLDKVAWYSLWGLAREAEAAIPVLISMISLRGSHQYYEARFILGALGPKAAPAVPALVSILEQARTDGTIIYHSATIDALEKIGPAAKPAVPLLIGLLNDAAPVRAGNDRQNAINDMHLRSSVIAALGGIGDDSVEAVSAIRTQLTSELPMLRSSAVRALARLAKHSPEILVEIVGILKGDAPNGVRAQAALAISEMSCDRQVAIAPLTEALADPDPNVRRMAATALGSLGPTAKSALPALHTALEQAQCGLPRASSPAPQHGVMYQPLATAISRAIADIDPTRDD